MKPDVLLPCWPRCWFLRCLMIVQVFMCSLYVSTLTAMETQELWPKCAFASIFWECASTHLTWSHLCECMVCTAPKRLLHTAHTTEPRHIWEGVRFHWSREETRFKRERFSRAWLSWSLFKTSHVTRQPSLKRLSGIQVQLLSLCMGKHKILQNCSLSIQFNFIFEITNAIG